MSGLPRIVGSRELKTRLGAYLQQVREGATIVVTDHGLPIAELRPLRGAGGAWAEGLRELQTLGLISSELREPTPLMPFTPIQVAGRPLSETLLEDRRDRF